MSTLGNPWWVKTDRVKRQPDTLFLEYETYFEPELRHQCARPVTTYTMWLLGIIPNSATYYPASHTSSRLA